MSFHWEEIKQSKQSFTFKPQDNQAAICEPPVQENLVGSWETLCQIAIVDQSYKDHREEWTGCSG